MATKHKPKKSRAKPKPVDKVAEALRGMIAMAEANGNRDAPEVVAARAALGSN